MIVLILLAFVGMLTGIFLILGMTPFTFAEELTKPLSGRRQPISKQIQQVNHPKEPKGIRKTVLEAREMLILTGKGGKFAAICAFSLFLAAMGAVICIVIQNYFMLPVLAAGMGLLPFWYVLFTSHSYKKLMNNEIETGLSIITSSYLRSESMITAVEENIHYLNPPVADVFRGFLAETNMISADVKQALSNMKPKLDNYVFREWVDAAIPMSTFVGGFPFASSGYNDGRGYYFAKDSNGGLVILDTWERGNDRTNSSFVIMGVAGIGKSTVVKHIMLSEYMKGTKILCIDPESEYKDMCRNLNGSWLNAGGGKNGRSNLLQIRPAPRDDDDETDKLYTDEGNGMSDMALHMKTLEIEFSLYLPSLTDMQKAILKQTIIELYNQFGIFWETDIRQLKATDFPILSDLHALLEKKAEANKENPVYRDLAMLLYDAAAGSDSFLWNGHTTLEANSRFICLDTHDLQNASDNVKRTQYLNLLSWCWEEMSRDRNERCLLVCDEAYLMIDPQVPQSLVFLRNVEKRARKYEAGLAIISHSVVDFLAPEVKMYGQALLDIPCYKILMGCDGKNLQETKDLYNLTDAEQELLESKRRGHALFIIGSKRLHVNFEIPAYKFSYMGKAGGR